MAIRYVEIDAPKGKPAPHAKRATKAVAEMREKISAPKPKPKTRAPNGTFDRTTYQRELMRKRRAVLKQDAEKP